MKLPGLIITASLLAGAAFAEDIPINPDVRQDTLATTTCQHGWTKTVRPPVSYTGIVKRRMMAEIGVPPEGEPDVILDHRIPIVLGGSPDDVSNFILQPADESKDKDRVEVCLARMVCAGKVTLAEAQNAIWKNWRAAAHLCAGYSVLPKAD